jgi:hypothetical protein
MFIETMIVSTLGVLLRRQGVGDAIACCCYEPHNYRCWRRVASAAASLRPPPMLHLCPFVSAYVMSPQVGRPYSLVLAERGNPHLKEVFFGLV